MGSYPSKTLKEKTEPKYYDLREILDEWAQHIYNSVWKKKNNCKSVQDVYFRYNFSFLRITDMEPVFEKSVESLETELQNIQYTTVIDEREYINASSMPQGCTFLAEGNLETTFSAELTRALKIDDKCNVSFTFDTKKVPEQQRLGKGVKHQVRIEEMRHGKLKYEAKDKLKWSASYPVKVGPNSKVYAQLLVKAKEESLEFTQPIKLEGHILVEVIKNDSTDALVMVERGDIHAIMEYFVTRHKEARDNGFTEVVNDDQDGYVLFEAQGKVKWSLGVQEIIRINETPITESN